MNLLKNVLAIVGVLTLTLNSAADLQYIISLSQQISYIVNNWTDLVHQVWMELCSLLGLPVIAFLAKPFSFLIASFALAISASISLASERDAFFRGIVERLKVEASKAAPDPVRAIAHIQSMLAKSTRLSVFDPGGNRVLDMGRGGSRRILSSVLYVSIITALYSATGLPDDLTLFVAALLFMNQWFFLYMVPFAFCAALAGRLGIQTWSREKAISLKEVLYFVRHDNPGFTQALEGYILEQSITDRLPGAEEGKPSGRKLFDALTTTVPSSFFESRVYTVMADRAVASLILLAGVYVVSYAIMILDEVGMF